MIDAYMRVEVARGILVVLVNMPGFNGKTFEGTCLLAVGMASLIC